MTRRWIAATALAVATTLVLGATASSAGARAVRPAIAGTSPGNPTSYNAMVKVDGSKVGRTIYATRLLHQDDIQVYDMPASPDPQTPVYPGYTDLFIRDRILETGSTQVPPGWWTETYWPIDGTQPHQAGLGVCQEKFYVTLSQWGDECMNLVLHIGRLPADGSEPDFRVAMQIGSPVIASPFYQVTATPRLLGRVSGRFGAPFDLTISRNSAREFVITALPVAPGP